MMRVRRDDDSFLVKESCVGVDDCVDRMEELLGMVTGVTERGLMLWSVWLGVEWVGRVGGGG